MKKWEELTSDELNLLEVLYWVAMFPDNKYVKPLKSNKTTKSGQGKSIRLEDLYLRQTFDSRMKQVKEEIIKQEGEGLVPKWPYEPTRMKYDANTGVNPLRSILNHLSMDGFLEVSEEMSDDEALKEAATTKDGLKYDFKLIHKDNQNKIFIQICREGLVVAEQWIAHRKKMADQKAELAAQQEEIAAQKAETEASKRLERIIGVMGGLAVVVAMLEWNWTEANLTMTIARFIMIAVLVGLAVWQWDAIRALFGLDKSKQSDKVE